MPTIPVDVHVSRVSKRIGLVKKDAGPEEVRKVLEEIIPASKRHVVNLGFVRFGRKMCLPRNPKCQGCPFTCICDYYFDKYLK
jgi:endonuclease-3